MQTPAFIFGLLDAELRRVQVELLKNVATKYNLNHATLVSEFIDFPTPCEQNTTTTEVYIKHKKSPLPSSERRCMARVYNRGKGGQCSKYRCEESDYCAIHCKNLRHGRIDESAPRDLFPTHASALYK